MGRKAMTEHRPKSIRTGEEQARGWLGFTAACMLALAMAVGVTVAIYGNFTYNPAILSIHQTEQMAQAVESSNLIASIKERIEVIFR